MSKPTIIGMLHIPINTLLAAPEEWRRGLGLPEISHDELDYLDRLEPGGFPDRPWEDAVQEQNVLPSILDLDCVKFLKERMLAEAALYVENGMTTLMIENTGAPYFVRGAQPHAIYWVMRALADVLREAYPSPAFKLGIQVLAFSDDWAMDIACRCRLDFIRCESVLFEGIRPEGRTPNHGNLAMLYRQRAGLVNRFGLATAPRVMVDLQKKHTVFPAELEPLEVWLENIIFEKLEGLIITGRGTGLPVQEAHLAEARTAIEKAKALPYFPRGLELPLWIGSGVTTDNLAMCAAYADGLIIGSALKENGYWECPLDAARIHPFMEAWQALP